MTVPDRWISYDFAVLRAVPHPHIGTFVPVGVVMHARTEEFIGMRAVTEPAELRQRVPDTDVELLSRYLVACRAICDGDANAGPVALAPPSERFHWLTSPRSDVIQSSPVHEGVCADPAQELDDLFRAYVEAPVGRQGVRTPSMTLGLASGSVYIAPYDPAWAEAFASERMRILAAVGDLPLVVEHGGSTSVPGLASKPILDIMLGRPAEVPPARYVAPLEAIGYLYRGEYELPGRDYYVRNAADGRRTHHLHMVALGTALWRDHLAFRDYLRSVPERAAAYARLKQELAARHPNDRDAYLKGKNAFIRETLALANSSGSA